MGRIHTRDESAAEARAILAGTLRRQDEHQPSLCVADDVWQFPEQLTAIPHGNIVSDQDRGLHPRISPSDPDWIMQWHGCLSADKAKPRSVACRACETRWGDATRAAQVSSFKLIFDVVHW
mmetsp:Transcript_43968/g.115509  ORF Transcript_43968/g.115509 Transcript_43968/m.115509 type:complete len:121 (-) Transcript_43968:548-910(-)